MKHAYKKCKVVGRFERKNYLKNLVGVELNIEINVKEVGKVKFGS
jgi:hypothetical protein